VSHKKAQKAQKAVQKHLWLVMLICLVPAATVAQDSLAQQQSRGRQIYVQGTSRSGKEILAYLGDASLEVPGNTLPCAGCHGLDGRGKPEGGVNPSNVTWEFLTKPYGLKHATGRQHPPYTERGLELAITRGLDPAGNKLLMAMPRYVMSRDDLNDLVTYLQLLGKDRDPGITDNKIVIGTLVETSGPLAEWGKAITAVTNAAFEEVNSQGGLYGRRLELHVIESSAETRYAARAKLESALKEQQIFAIANAMIAGTEKEIVPVLSQNETPLIGPFSLYPQTGFPLNRQVFYLLPGLDDQAKSLAKFIAEKPEFRKSNIAMIAPRIAVFTNVIDAVRAKRDASPSVTVIQYETGHCDVAEAIKQSRQAAAEVVFLMGSSDDALAFMREAEKLNWFPAVLMPGGATGASVFAAPIGFDRKVFFSFATSPADHTAEGLNEFRAFQAKYKLPSGLITAQISAYVAAKILIEGLKRVGKDVSREKLIQVLESLHQYPTGLTQPITYGPNRRIGATGAYVVTIDLKEKKFVPVSGWVDSN
jgi:ABC-type branched-subunit amino acid transport system substrate-binding protein